MRISDGDVVLTEASGNVKWRAGVSGAVTVVNFEGSVFAQDANGRVLWSVRGPAGSVLSIRNCELALIGSDGNPVWGSSSGYFTSK